MPDSLPPLSQSSKNVERRRMLWERGCLVESRYSTLEVVLRASELAGHDPHTSRTSRHSEGRYGDSRWSIPCRRTVTRPWFVDDRMGVLAESWCRPPRHFKSTKAVSGGRSARRETEGAPRTPREQRRGEWKKARLAYRYRRLLQYACVEPNEL